MRYKPSSLLILLFIIWAGMQSYLLFSMGIMTTGEPPKYISEAQTFLETRHFSSSNFWFYSTIIFLIIFSLKLHAGFGLIIAIQLLFNGLATFSIYHLVKRWFHPKIGFICAVLFILNYPLQEFNVYVQTDSLFYSFSVIYAVYLLHICRLTVQHLLIILLSLILLSITRPTGLLFIPSTFIYLFFCFFKTIGIGRKIIAVLLVSGIFLYILNKALGSGGELDFMQPYLHEHIVCGVPTISGTADIKTAADSNSLYGLWYYIVHNFDQFIRMAALKVFAFFSLMRSYYSTGHNIILAVLFYPLYILVIAGLPWWWKNNRMHLLILGSTILMILGSVVLTCDDWHNRFFLTITPLLVLLASPTINRLFKMFSNRVYPNR